MSCSMRTRPTLAQRGHAIRCGMAGVNQKADARSSIILIQIVSSRRLVVLMQGSRRGGPAKPSDVRSMRDLRERRCEGPANRSNGTKMHVHRMRLHLDFSVDRTRGGSPQEEEVSGTVGQNPRSSRRRPVAKDSVRSTPAKLLRTGP